MNDRSDPSNNGAGAADTLPMKASAAPLRTSARTKVLVNLGVSIGQRPGHSNHAYHFRGAARAASGFRSLSRGKGEAFTARVDPCQKWAPAIQPSSVAPIHQKGLFFGRAAAPGPDILTPRPKVSGRPLGWSSVAPARRISAPSRQGRPKSASRRSTPIPPASSRTVPRCTRGHNECRIVHGRKGPYVRLEEALNRVHESCH
jgi:hypothetical protein